MTTNKKTTYRCIFTIALTTSLLISLLPSFNSKFLNDNQQVNDSTVSPVNPQKSVLIRGTKYGPDDLDPTDSWDSASNDVIRQVAEPLFFYNLSDPDLPRLNWLALGYIWASPTNLTITLRPNVKFHDGTFMNASAVKWNFDRLMYLMNHTNQLPANFNSPDGRAKIHSLYEFPDGSPVFASTSVIDNLTVQILLNAPYTQILAAMAYISCSILSPTSTPFDRFLDKSDPNDLLVGTGPYVYEYYTADSEVRFHRWEEYWGTPANTGPAEFDVLVFDVIFDDTARNNAMLAGQFDVLSGVNTDYIDTFILDPNIMCYESTEPNLVIWYLSMNNDHYTIADGDVDDAAIGLNITWREAITYAINHTYIVHDYWQDHRIRANSWISPGYSPYFDDTLWDDIAPDDGNITHARKIIKDALGPVNTEVAGRDIYTDADWNILDPDYAPVLASFNYSYNWGTNFRADLYLNLTKWLGQIGINVIDGGTTWEYFRDRAYGYRGSAGYDQLQLFWSGWGPDYLDPMNMIQPLISNISGANSAQVNDPKIEAWIHEYNTNVSLLEPERIEIIQNLTHRCSAELFTHVFGYHNKIFSVHAADLYDVAYNAAGRWWAYPIKSAHYPKIESSGNFTYLVGETGNSIQWNLTATSLSSPWYYVYNDTTLIASDSWTTGDSINVDVDDHGVGDYVYKIVVQNGQRTLENHVKVSVIYNLSIVINSPLQNQLFGFNAPTFDISLIGPIIDTTWYSLDGGVTNTPFTGLSGTIDQTEWDKVGNGTITLTFYVNNSLGYMEQAEVIVRKDVTAPIITINSPLQNELFEFNSPTYDISLSRTDFDTTWYSLDEGSTNIIFTGLTGTIDQAEWDKIGNGTVTIAFYVNNSFGYMEQAEVTVRKDVSAPTITINSPLQNELFGLNAPTYDISLSRTDFDTTWYSLDGGVTNIIFTGFTGIIDQAEWDKMGNGTVTITFNVNNSFGYTEQAEVTVRKDLMSTPTIIINSPITAQEFEYAPIFDITVISSSVDSAWYTIDDGVTNFTITSVVGSINEAAWNNAPNGAVTIKFYVRNLAGNTGTAYVIITKNVPEETGPEIPGFPLMILAGFTLLTMLYIRKKLKYKKV